MGLKAEQLSNCLTKNKGYKLRIMIKTAIVEDQGRYRDLLRLILTGADAPTPPCGGCRQVLAEFGGAEVPVRSVTLQGRTDEHTLGTLLPHAFGLDARV